MQLPQIIRAIEACLPAGVKVQIRQHEETDEENRYVPDRELNTLKEELEIMGGPSKKKWFLTHLVTFNYVVGYLN